MPQLWSGVGLQQNMKGFTDLIRSNTMLVALPIDSCPWHFKKFCAPSTAKVLCPWHYKTFTHVLTMWAKFSADSSCQHEWFLKSPLSLGVLSFSGWVWSFPFYPGRFSCAQHSPWKWNGLLYHRSWCPTMVFGQSPPLTHNNCHWQGLWWHHTLPDVSLLATWKMSYI